MMVHHQYSQIIASITQPLINIKWPLFNQPYIATIIHYHPASAPRFGMGSVLGVPLSVKEFCVAGSCVKDQGLVLAPWTWWVG